jgi:hypothetical protein
MNFEEFHKKIHEKGFQIVCLNDYQMKGAQHTFIAIQDKKGHGFHAEGSSENMAMIFQELIAKI